MARVGLTFSDRSEISTASKAGWSVRRIARHLGRCPSVISRELHRNSTKTRRGPLAPGGRRPDR
ncbi:MAG: helix-turn-helix domain-containing protein [Brachybacterium sp.]|uniref:helix-turn-helix domain-containing protein n=1 Tax=Brachybacterium sp. TaxID=1891286 RepID=UPI003242BAC9